MRVQFLDVDHPGWPQVLSGLRHDWYHRPEYLRLEARRLKAAAEAFTVTDGDRLFFVPYLIRSCDPLFADATTGALDVVSPYGYPSMLLNDAGRDQNFAREAIAALCSELAQRSICSAFFRMHPLLCDGFQNLFPEETFSEHGETVAVDLTLDEDAIWKNVRPGHRATIRKCERAGYTTRFVRLANVLDEFLAIYEQTMDRVKASEMYYFDREYFADLATFNNIHCCIAEKDSTIGAACIVSETDGIVQFHLGGTRTDCLAHAPFHLTLYRTSLWGKQRGNRWVHFGGGIGSSNDSLLHFKRGFSPLAFQFFSARFILNPATYRQLIDLHARRVNVRPELLLESTYFPAYRASL